MKQTIFMCLESSLDVPFSELELANLLVESEVSEITFTRSVYIVVKPMNKHK